MKVICKNPECSEFGKEVIIPVTTYKFINGKAVSKDLSCPICKQDREETVPEGEFNVHFAKFSAMSKEDKKRVLKKRSDEHFKKNIKEGKEYTDRKFFGLEN